LGYWLTKNPNRNFRVPEFRVSKYFGSDTVHHYADPKFRVPEPSTPLFLADHPVPNNWELNDDVPGEEVFFVDVLPP